MSSYGLSTRYREKFGAPFNAHHLPRKFFFLFRSNGIEGFGPTPMLTPTPTSTTDARRERTVLGPDTRRRRSSSSIRTTRQKHFSAQKCFFRMKPRCCCFCFCYKVVVAVAVVVVVVIVVVVVVVELVVSSSGGCCF